MGNWLKSQLCLPDSRIARVTETCRLEHEMSIVLIIYWTKQIDIKPSNREYRSPPKARYWNTTLIFSYSAFCPKTLKRVMLWAFSVCRCESEEKDGKIQLSTACPQPESKAEPSVGFLHAGSVPYLLGHAASHAKWATIIYFKASPTQWCPFREGLAFL